MGKKGGGGGSSTPNFVFTPQQAQDYLDANPDIAQYPQVQAQPGMHWYLFGQNEGRPLAPEGRYPSAEDQMADFYEQYSESMQNQMDEYKRLLEERTEKQNRENRIRGEKELWGQATDIINEQLENDRIKTTLVGTTYSPVNDRRRKELINNEWKRLMKLEFGEDTSILDQEETQTQTQNQTASDGWGSGKRPANDIFAGLGNKKVAVSDVARSDTFGGIKPTGVPITKPLDKTPVPSDQFSGVMPGENPLYPGTFPRSSVRVRNPLYPVTKKRKTVSGEKFGGKALLGG